MADQRFLEFAQASDDLFAAIRTARGRIAEGAGLTLSQTRLLEPLSESGALSVGGLATRAGVSSPTATRMLKALERDGMVVRSRAVGNERVVEVSLTERGRRSLREQSARLRERQRRVYDALDPEDRSRATPLVRILTELTWEMHGLPAPPEPAPEDDD